MRAKNRAAASLSRAGMMVWSSSMVMAILSETVPWSSRIRRYGPERPLNKMEFYGRSAGLSIGREPCAPSRFGFAGDEVQV